jgi:DNA polymerase-3 subunit beta
MLKIIENVTVNRKDLLKVLQSLKKVAPSRTTDDAWLRGLIYKESNSLYLAAANSEQVIKQKVCDTTQEIPTLSFDIAMILAFARKAKTDTIDMNFTDNNSLMLKSGAVTFSDQAFSEEMWGSNYCDLTDEFRTFVFDLDELRQVFSDLTYAISTEATRYYLNGIYMHQNSNGEVVFVATDGRKLSRRVLETGTTEMMQKGVIIPKEAVKYFLDFTKGYEGSVEVEISESRLSFSISDLLLQTVLVDGNFPDYRRAIPNDHNLRITVDKDELLENLDIFSIQKKSTNAVKFSYDELADVLNLERETRESGTLKASVYATANKPELAEYAIFGLSGVYLSQTLGSVHSNVLDIHLGIDEKTDSEGKKFKTFNTGPLTIVSTSRNHTDDLDVIVPMRIN